MWYTIKYDDRNAFMFFNEVTRSMFFADDIENPMYQAYLAWVAEGNTAEEWNPE
jgi:hypothetical protein